MTRAPMSFVLAAAATAAAAAAACQGEPPAPPGPAYTPATADMLRALAADCQIQPAPDGGESRTCRGRQATMRIEIDGARRIRELDMMVLASTGVEEAWVLYENVLPIVVGRGVADAAHDKLRGETAPDVVAGARIATLIDGQRYKVRLTWGR
jgi:hypothetical protein